MLYRLSRAASNTAGFSKPEVSQEAFLATVWALTTLSLLFLPARLYARWTTRHRFFWDDFFVTFAWLSSLIISVCITVFNDATYNFMRIVAGPKPFPPNIKALTMQFTRLFVLVPMIFYIGLWSIKLAFLLFFRSLGARHITSLDRWWWIVTTTTCLCFFLCYATLPYRCTLVSFKVTASPECQTQGLSFISMGVNCALDILTDCLILSIPFLILRRIRISKRQKLALSAVFSLVVVTMVFAIIRATITTVGVQKQIDPIWMYMWTSIEINVAIIVACVAPYRTLFIRHRDPTRNQAPLRQSLKERAFKLFSSSDRSARRHDENLWSADELPYLAPWPNEGNGEEDVSRHDSHLYSTKTPPATRHCQEPWMTADLPYLEPWRDHDRQEPTSDMHHSGLPQSVPRAYIP